MSGRARGAGLSSGEEDPDMLHRRTILLAGAALVPAAALAHHGWSWAEDEEFTLAGALRGARLGNPHGELDVEAADGMWIAEIGQPWRNERAGLTDDLLVAGLELTLEGHRSRNPDERVMKAERVIIAGRLYDLYPDRS
jgi:hypothetical protein